MIMELVYRIASGAFFGTDYTNKFSLDTLGLWTSVKTPDQWQLQLGTQQMMQP